jgi:hypothetical protein
VAWLWQADGGATPAGAQWDATPGVGAVAKKPRSRWDETPAVAGAAVDATPMMGATPTVGATPVVGATPMGGLGMETPLPSQLQQNVPMTPEQFQVRNTLFHIFPVSSLSPVLSLSGLRRFTVIR